jgi:hypothetical protein
MRLSGLCVLNLLAAPAGAFVAPNLPKTQQPSSVALEVIRSKNFKNAKLVKPEVDAGGLAKSVVRADMEPVELSSRGDRQFNSLFSHCSLPLLRDTLVPVWPASGPYCWEEALLISQG